MLKYSYQRSPGGARYSRADLTAARALANVAAAQTLTPQAMAAMTSDAGIEAVCDVSFELESNRTNADAVARLVRPTDTTVVLAPVDPAMTATSLVDGRRVPHYRYAIADVSKADDAVVFDSSDVDHPPPVGVFPVPAATGKVGVEITYPTQRRINRVEVAGVAGAGLPTQATVETYLDATGTTRGAPVTGTAVNGDLVVNLGGEVDVFGVLVTIDAHTAGSSGGVASPVWLAEVNPSRVVDVSDDVANLTLAWSREADPGSSTTPVGNYQASELTLELDDTAGEWNPATNAALDVGHRIEAAVGVRWINDPAAIGASSIWSTNSTTVVIEPVERYLGSQIATLTVLTAQTGVGLNRYWTSLLPVVAGTAVTASIYVRAGTMTDVYARLWWYDAAGTLLSSNNGPMVTLSPDWQLSTITATAPVGATQFRFGSANGTTDTVVGQTWSVAEPAISTLNAGTVEELLPAGVFYSEPFETDSGRETVSIPAVDRLTRNSETTLEEAVRLNVTVDTLVRDLCRYYLDLDDDQVSITPSIGSVVIPYAYPTGDLGTYLADIAKATASTLHVDAYDRANLAGRADTSTAPVAEIRSDNALVGYRRPPGVDVTTSVVTVTASPLDVDVEATLWQLPSGGLTIPASASRQIIAPYESVPAISGRVAGIVADGSYTITASSFYADRAVLTVRNNETRSLVVATMVVYGVPLIERPLTARVADAPSVRRYGPRELTVDAAMVQTQAQLDLVAAVLLDTFKALDSNGERRLPELTLDALGVLYAEAGDRVTVTDAAGGVGSDYAMLGRTLTYADAALTLNDVHVREVGELYYAIVGQSKADDVYVAAY